MLFGSIWIVLAPVLAAQYCLAVAGLIVLSRRQLSVRAYIIWNIVILLVFFAGSIAFLIYNAVCPAPKGQDKPIMPQAESDEPIDEQNKGVYNNREEDTEGEPND